MSSKKIFLENENTAVFTTRFVMQKKEPITYVTHEIEDGAWQFFSDSEFEDFGDIMVVTLKNILDLDNTIIEIADLPLGYMASRKNQKDNWEISKL